MTKEQLRYKHDQLSQHASMRMKKGRSSCVVEQSSGVVEGSSSHVHESPTHDDAHVIVVHAPVAHPLIGPDVVAPQGFLGGQYDMLLLPRYAYHVTDHIHEREL